MQASPTSVAVLIGLVRVGNERTIVHLVGNVVAVGIQDGRRGGPGVSGLAVLEPAAPATDISSASKRLALSERY